ncbi:LuxR C-terminal-related transcriptional regulator [Cellulomonas sp. URHD0024]|uniref:LuxR C-terminal-related transcriptional regulator n=1 Tax=Cellulomonas sp. URHD0024 TaxID=1302620 RepID=UPI000419AE39|nr:LuxR C-terminal-related transcriptional regulator [Cellulomonas sp. URHD0024]
MSSVLQDGTANPARQTGARSAIPLPAAHILHRPRLDDALAVDVPLTLVVGPAGSGKTVAVSVWAAQVPGPVAWVTLDRPDLTGTAPWVAVAAALRECGVRVPSLVSLGDPVEGPRAFPTMLGAHVAAHAEAVVVVLDCDGPVPAELADGLERLLRQARGLLRLVILSHTDPPMPLLRHRLDGTVSEIRAADLAFRADEVAALLDGAGLDVSRASARALYLRTHGWAAGLRFAVLAARGRSDAEAAIRDVTGSGGPVAEYVRAGVLGAASAGDSRLLLDCSVVDVLRPGLVEVLGGRLAGQRLEQLGWASMEEQPGSFGVPPLLREALYAQLVLEDLDRSVELHRRAAHWLATAGRPAEATAHAARGGDWQSAARYGIEAGVVAEVLLGSPPADLMTVLAAMPVGAQGAGPAIVRAVAAVSAGDLREAASQVASARTDGGNDAAVDVLELVIASGTGDAVAVLAAADRVVATAVRRSDLAAAVDARRADALLLLGRLQDAGTSYRASGGRFGRLALVEALEGRLRTARSLAERALAGLGPADPAALIALAWVDAESDELDDAAAHLRLAGAVSVTVADPVPGTLRVLLGARLLRVVGDLEGAREVLAGLPDVPAWLADLRLLEDAALDLAASRPSTALHRHVALADPTSAGAQRLLWQVRLAEWGGGSTTALPDADASLTAQVEGWLLEASRRLSLGEPAAARRAVQRALGLAAPEKLRRPFREAPADVKRLLQVDPAIRVPSRRPSARPDARTAEHDPVEQLTEKEREVLGHLAAMLSTDEIAAAMFVSVNTVRTHVRNILRKLGVSRRNEAVRRARAMHLIPS